MAIIQDWKIRSTSAKCDVSGSPFLDGEEFYTCIFEDAESDGFLRKDYSIEAWNEVRNQQTQVPFSFWKSTYKAPQTETVDPRAAASSIEGMLRRFIHEDDPRTENARYILALMLERKKTLIPADTKETDTRTLLFYEHADNGDVFIVSDPGLRLDEIESVQREVVDLLTEEENKLTTSAESVEEAPDKVADSDESQSEQEGEKTAESEEETVSLSGEEASRRLVTDSTVSGGEEFADDVDHQLDDADDGEDPSAPDDKV